MAMPDTEVFNHESFGYIRANRVSGHTALFDSALEHQHYVSVTIGRASLHRRYSENYVMGDIGALIEVSMSESQFAQFITSMNVGSGAPCTLSRVNGKRVEEPPADINTRETFEKEVKAKAESMVGNVRDASAKLHALTTKKGGSITKAEVGEALALVQRAQMELVSNLPFLMSQFAEGIEKLIDRAKMDINAHAVMNGMRLSASDSNHPLLADK